MDKQTILKGRYKLKQKIGETLGRQTWLATDIKGSYLKPVIVKLLAFNPQLQWEKLKLFEREAQVLNSINHPRIPNYIDYFSVNTTEGSGLFWLGLVQNYIQGYSLQQLLNENKYFSLENVLDCAKEVLDILIYLHELSPPIIHRDIKPSNLILGDDHHIYLVDFGAVQDKAKAEGVTFTVVGTSGYVPPEQLWGKVVPASDLYALGATLIHLVTRIPPTELPQQRMQIQFKHRAKGIHPELANWIEKLIQPAPETRFQTARMALSALQNLSFQNQTPMRIYPSKTNESITNNYDSELRANYVWGWLSLIFCIGCLLLFVF
jgi:serine/threonine protein kinase